MTSVLHLTDFQRSKFQSVTISLSIYISQQLYYVSFCGLHADVLYEL